MVSIESQVQKNILINYFSTPYGELILGSYQHELCLADWRYRKMRDSIDLRIKTSVNADYAEGNSKILDETKEQLNQYFLGKRQIFDLPLLMIGTDFQKNVWRTLIQIQFGKTETYTGLSKKLGNEKAIRAVANANGANAISIIVPCHRIIGTDGSLIGYAGGLQAKKKLLDLEGALPMAQLNLF